MKKKFLTFLFAICLIVPCAFLFSACGKEPDKEPVSVTIDFSFNQDHYATFAENDYWEIDETTNTFKTTHMNAFAWDGYLFNVVATTANGDTKNLYEATENNPMGYKIDTDMPETDGRLPVGTYTFKLYCEEFNNGEYKAEACESETYTIIVEKEPIRVEGYEWQYNTSQNKFINIDTPISVSLDSFATFSGISQVSLADAGITNVRYVDEEPYTRRETYVGKYTAKVEYDADTTNFEYDHLPEKEFNWEIKKADIISFIDLNSLFGGQTEFVYSVDNTYTIEVVNIPRDIPLNYIGMGGQYSESQPGTYVCWPLFEQTDTENYTLITDYTEELKFTWKILPAKVYVNEHTVSLDIKNFTYDGNPVDIEQMLTISSNLQIEKLEGDTEKTNAGKYNLRVYVKPVDSDVVEIVGNNYIDYEWEIEKAPITLDTAHWWFGGHNVNNPVMDYDYSQFRPTLEGLSDMNHTITYYDSEGKEIADGKLEIGTYRAVVEIEYDEENFYLEFNNLEFEWQVVKSNYAINYEMLLEDRNEFYTYTVDNTATLDIMESGYYYGRVITHLFNYDGLTIKCSVNGAEPIEILDNTTSITFDATVAGVYTITFIIEGEDLEHYNPIDSSLLTTTINIVEAE